MIFWDEARYSLVHMLAYQAGRVVANTALSNGLRRTVGWTLDVMLLGIMDELERQQISRKIAAEMLGMTLRTYQRRRASVQEHAQSTGYNAWHRLYSKLQKWASREEILSWFEPQREPQIISLLHDMVMEGWLEVDERERYQAVSSKKVWTDEMLDEYVQLNVRFGEHEQDPGRWAEQLGVPVDQFERALERAEHATGSHEVNSVYATYALLKVCARHCLEGLNMENDLQATYAYLYRKHLSEEQLEALRRDLTGLQKMAVEIAERYDVDESELGELKPDEPLVEWSLICTYPFDE